MKNLTNKKLLELLRKKSACSDAVKWIGGKSLLTAWRTCPRADWMLWFAARAGVKKETIVLAGCACARLALKYVTAGEDRPRICIETTERWTRGEATIDEVRTARSAADASAADAYAADAYAADASAYAAYAVDADAYAADAYAYAAYAADAYAYTAYAADASGSGSAREQMQKQCANKVRKIIKTKDLKVGGQTK